MGKRNKQDLYSDVLNSQAYISFYNRLIGLAQSVYKWGNLPETIDHRFLEETLLKFGACAIFFDEVIGYLALPFSTNNRLDVYNNPTSITAYANNGYQKTLKQSDCVIVYDSITRSSILPTIQNFALRLYNLDRCIDVNVNAQKTPVLVRATETQRLSVLNVYKKYSGNEPFIFADEGLNPECLKVLNTQAPFVAPALFDLKTNIWNEFLTFIGIANTTINKKERLITDEVVRSQGGIIASGNIRLSTRKQACAELQEKFGLQVNCVERVSNCDDTTEGEGDTYE